MRRRGICQCGHEGPLTADGYPLDHKPKHVRRGADGQPVVYEKPTLCKGVFDRAELVRGAPVDVSALVFTPPVREPADDQVQPLPRRAEAELLASIARRNLLRNKDNVAIVVKRNSTHRASIVSLTAVVERGWAVLCDDRCYELTSAGERALKAWRAHLKTVAATPPEVAALHHERHGDGSRP